MIVPLLRILISSLSVAITISSTREQFSKASIFQQTRGLPQKSFMFLRGIDLLPPLTGINAIVFIFYSRITILLGAFSIYHAESFQYPKFPLFYKSEI